MSNDDTLPDNVNDLVALVTILRERLSHQTLFIDQLLEQIKLAQHHRFGVKSEHISPDQLRLLLEEGHEQSPEDLSLIHISEPTRPY